MWPDFTSGGATNWSTPAPAGRGAATRSGPRCTLQPAYASSDPYPRRHRQASTTACWLPCSPGITDAQTRPVIAPFKDFFASMSKATPARRPRVAIYSMFCLADQFDLAAEYRDMLIDSGQDLRCAAPEHERPRGRRLPCPPASGSRSTACRWTAAAARTSSQGPAAVSPRSPCHRASPARIPARRAIYLPDIIPHVPHAAEVLQRLPGGHQLRRLAHPQQAGERNGGRRRDLAGRAGWIAGKSSYVDCFTCRARAATEKT
jgi:hypothetical protein